MDMTALATYGVGACSDNRDVLKAVASTIIASDAISYCETNDAKL